MKVSRRTVLWSTAGWVGVVLVLVAWVAFLWSMPLLAQIVASLALLAFAFTLAVLYQEYYDWLIGQINAVGLEAELADVGWNPLPTELKMAAHEADREVSRETRLRAAGGKVDKMPEPTPQPTPPPRDGPDLTDAFHRWKERPPLPDQPSFTELVAQVTGEPGSEPESEPPSEDEAQEIVDQVVEKYPFLPKPEGIE